MCHKSPPQMGSTGTMSAGSFQNPFAQAQRVDTYNQIVALNSAPSMWPKSMVVPSNPFGQLQVAAPSNSMHITVNPVSNGFVIKVSKNSTTIERIVSDFENLGDEIMAALAEIQLGK